MNDKMIHPSLPNLDKEILDSHVEEICECIEQVISVATSYLSDNDIDYIFERVSEEIGPRYEDRVRSGDYIKTSLDNYRLRRILADLEAGGYLSAHENDTKLKELREDILEELKDGVDEVKEAFNKLFGIEE